MELNEARHERIIAAQKKEWTCSTLFKRRRALPRQLCRQSGNLNKTLALCTAVMAKWRVHYHCSTKLAPGSWDVQRFVVPGVRERIEHEISGFVLWPHGELRAHIKDVESCSKDVSNGIFITPKTAKGHQCHRGSPYRYLHSFS
mmetsp:Transcript_3067/g.4439  ORF Transcript_3067/g.4439 Transcript_3067/m.4439 type:complete len:144 (+) Transcript_3067:236-667(+)